MASSMILDLWLRGGREALQDLENEAEPPPEVVHAATTPEDD
jgi:hypothetical protein